MQLEEGDTDSAIANLRTVLKNDPESVKALLLLGRAHLASNSIELAKDNYKQAIRMQPTNEKVVLEYSNLLLRNNEANAAEEVLKEFLSRSPDSLDALKILARIKIARGDWVAAQEIANQIKQAGDKSAIADQILGAAYRGLKQYGQSIDAFKRAYEASPAEIRPIVSLVRTYLKAGKKDEAMGFLKTVIGAHPGNLIAHVLIGQLYQMDNDSTDAEAAFDKAIELNPRQALGYRAKAMLYFTQKKTAEAIAVLDKGLAQIPKSMPLGLTKAGILERAGEYDKAIELYEKMLTWSKQSDLVANNLASLLSDHRSDKESLNRAYELARRFEKSSVAFYIDTLGWIQYKRGEYSASVTLLEKAVKAQPEIPILRYHYGMSLLSIGNKEHAKTELEKSISLSKGRFAQADMARKALEKL